MIKERKQKNSRREKKTLKTNNNKTYCRKFKLIIDMDRRDLQNLI